MQATWKLPSLLLICICITILPNWILRHPSVYIANAQCPEFTNRRLVPLHNCNETINEHGYLEVLCVIHATLPSYRQESIIRTQSEVSILQAFLRSTEPVTTSADLTNTSYCLELRKLWIKKWKTPPEDLDIKVEDGNDQVYGKWLNILFPFLRECEIKIHFTEFVNFAEAQCSRTNSTATSHACDQWNYRICYSTPECTRGGNFEDFPGADTNSIFVRIEFLFHNLKEWNVYTAKIPLVALSLPPKVTTFPALLARKFSYLHIENLTLYNSRLHPRLTKYTLPALPSATYLSFLDCDFDSIDSSAFSQLPLLQHLNLRGNRFQSIPFAVLQIPKLVHLDLSFNHLPDTKCFDANTQNSETGLATIKHLTLSDTRVCKLTSNSLSVFRTSLEKLEIRNSNLEQIDELTFLNMTNLQILDISRNHLQVIPAQAFSTLINIRFIDLSRNQIKNLNFISNIGNSIEFNGLTSRFSINLQANSIKDWQSSTFTSQSEYLMEIDMSKNQISTVSENMYNSIKNISSLTFKENPFDCSSCKLQFLQKWLNQTHPASSRSNVTYWTDEYLCSFPPELLNVPALEAPFDIITFCHIFQINYLKIIGIPVLIILVILAILVAVSFHFRWYFRYFAYWLRAQTTSLQRQVQDGKRNFVYDAFISYSSEDIQWVKNQLVPKLEQEAGFKLCLHDRNFNPGDVITDNIIQSINESRKIVLVLSESFIRSKWCNMEAQLAQHRLYEQSRDAMILIKLTEIEKNAISKTIYYLMKTRTYLEWPSEVDLEPGRRKFFWLQLEKALAGIPSRKRKQSVLLESQV